ncbi:hypothetical protein [Entomohabitans teleogrylli]|uniref:hypothetical protein n=1 Tax=Entomohabitans teleogrylli TaxID=1384589 RepID=UPI00073D5BD1|nr:hypothetical protein [Entomohabitans teleogrylli]
MTETLSLALSGRNLYLDVAGNLATKTGLSACLQNCETAMLAQRNEMIYAMDRGLPNRETLWDYYRPAQFQAAAISTIENVSGVLRVESFSVDRSENEFSYTAVIVTEWGTGAISNGRTV